MKTKSNKIILVLTGTLMAASHGFGAVINYSGSIADNSGAEVADWRTATTAKTLDSDSDGIYGTLGYSILRGNHLGGGGAVAWNTAITQSQVSGLSLMQAGTAVGFALLVGDSNGAADWDEPTDVIPPIADRNMGYGGAAISGANGPSKGPITLNQMFTFGVTGALGSGLRMGIAADSLYAGGRIQLTELRVVVGGAQANATLATNNATPDMYFFDLYGLQIGDTIEIWGANSHVTTAPTIIAALNGVTFDAPPPIIPEPSTLVLAVAGALALALRGRR